MGPARTSDLLDSEGGGAPLPILAPDAAKPPLGEWPELARGPSGSGYGIYVHCLYCRVRCPYCDFNVAIYREDRVRPMVAALRAELARYAGLPWAGRVPVTSLFFGGGTPSLFPPECVADIVGDARRGLGLLPDAEVTLEANPEGLDRARLIALRAAGVTRLSLGVQALDDEVLRRLGRTHSADVARAAFAAARAAGFDNVSVDLVYGAPGQDRAVWARTLGETLAWRPEHLSAYALTLEPGTAFGRRPPAGLPGEAEQVAHFEILLAATAEAGLARYEVSNFARPGFESRHNLLYWRRADYLGIGPGAHGGLGALRWMTWRAQTRYRTALQAGEWPVERWERLSPAQVAGERIVLGLRLAEGVPLTWLSAHFAGRAERLGTLLTRYGEAGVLAVGDGRVALTDRGVLLSDSVFADLL